MSVGVLIITHNLIGSALLESATKMFGACPIMTETLSVTNDSDIDLLRSQAIDMARDLDQGDGVLVLTDIYGSTPSNIATAIAVKVPIAVVAGINLPMLVRVLNYHALGLAQLTEKAITGGRDGVLTEA